MLLLPDLTSDTASIPFNKHVSNALRYEGHKNKTGPLPLRNTSKLETDHKTDNLTISRECGNCGVSVNQGCWESPCEREHLWPGDGNVSALLRDTVT